MFGNNDRRLVREYKGSVSKAHKLFAKDFQKMSNRGYEVSSEQYIPGSWSGGQFLGALLLCFLLIGLIIFVYMAVVKPPGKLVVSYRLVSLVKKVPDAMQQSIPLAAPATSDSAAIEEPTKAITNERELSPLLGIGIFLGAPIFAWFTLRKGYSKQVRGISFAWMALMILSNALDKEKKNALADSIPPVSAQQSMALANNVSPQSETVIPADPLADFPNLFDLGKKSKKKIAKILGAPDYSEKEGCKAGKCDVLYYNNDRVNIMYLRGKSYSI